MINRIHCLTRIRTGMVLSLLVGFSGTASGITIVNPSFEDVALGSPFFSTNVADVPGWTRSGAAGNGALWRVGYSDALGKVTVAGEGQQFTTLGGGSAGPGITTWSQTIGGFTIGAPYRLDFLMSAECGPDANTPQCQTQSLTATIHQLADVSQVFTETNAVGTYWKDWKAESLTFTADSTNVTLNFTANAPFNVGIDNVSITQVPEPNSLALVVFGLAGVGWKLRNRVSKLF